MIDMKSLTKKTRTWFASELAKIEDEMLEVLEDIDEIPLDPKQRLGIAAHLAHIFENVLWLKPLEAEGFVSLKLDYEKKSDGAGLDNWPLSRDIIVSRRLNRRVVLHRFIELMDEMVRQPDVEYVLENEFIDPNDPSSNEENAEYALKTHYEAKFLNSFRYHLKQIEKIKTNAPFREDPKSENDEAPWGRYAFGPERVGVPDEPNTDDEEDVLLKLKDHIKADVKLPSRTADEIKDLIKRGMYTDVLELDTEQHPVVYRGMSIKRQSLVSLFDEPDEDSFNKMTRPGQIIDVNVTLSPRGGYTASWTTSPDEARRFARSTDDFDPNGFRVVFYARTSQNPGSFILNPDEIYSIISIKNYAYEQETIGVGPIRVFKIEFLPRGERPKKK